MGREAGPTVRTDRRSTGGDVAQAYRARSDQEPGLGGPGSGDQAGQLPCEALPDRVTVEVGADTDYEPDAVVNGGPLAPGDAIAATNPVVVVEVLSPSTESIDLADKLADYFRLGSIQHYLIVRARWREVIHHSRSGSEIVSRVINIGSIVLDPPGISIDLADIYPATG